MQKPGIYIPNYMSFHNANTYLGSFNGLRFKLVPDMKDKENEVIHAEYWYGPLCYEKSVMDGKADFPLTQDGIDQMQKWLEDLAEKPGK